MKIEVVFLPVVDLTAVLGVVLCIGATPVFAADSSDPSVIVQYSGANVPDHVMYRSVLRMFANVGARRGPEFVRNMVAGGLNLNPNTGGSSLYREGEEGYVRKKMCDPIADLMLAESGQIEERIRRGTHAMLCNDWQAQPVDTLYQRLNGLYAIGDQEATRSLARVVASMEAGLQPNFNRWLDSQKSGLSETRRDQKIMLEQSGASVHDRVGALCAQLSLVESS